MRHFRCTLGFHDYAPTKTIVLVSERASRVLQRCSSCGRQREHLVPAELREDDTPTVKIVLTEDLTR